MLTNVIKVSKKTAVKEIFLTVLQQNISLTAKYQNMQIVVKVVIRIMLNYLFSFSCSKDIVSSSFSISCFVSLAFLFRALAFGTNDKSIFSSAFSTANKKSASRDPQTLFNWSSFKITSSNYFVTIDFWSFIFLERFSSLEFSKKVYFCLAIATDRINWFEIWIVWGRFKAIWQHVILNNVFCF